MDFTQKNSSYFCEKCQFTTSNKNDYSSHILTAKHKLRTNSQNFEQKAYCCDNCDKSYSSRNGLWYHLKKCEPSKKTHKKTHHDNAVEKPQDNELILQLLKQNNELTQKLMEISSSPSIINSTINSNNKQFNVQVYLNENCKNAMTITDFVGSLKIKSSEIENIGKLGYVEGLSNIFIRGLKELDETERPMHCVDKKRDILYIKESEGWNKDENKEKVKNAIGQIAHKNFLRVLEWKEENPASQNTETKTHCEYMRMVNQVMASITPDDDGAGINKIIKKVANEVYVDKSKNIFA